MFIGETKQSTSISYTSSVSNTITVNIGNRDGYGNLRGKISDIQVYKAIITDTDVLGLNNGELKDGLTAHWDFEGDALADKAGSNTLTQSGATIIDMV